MMPNLIEIVLIILIVMIVFGLGKLSDIGKALANMRVKYLEGRDGGDDQTIDITPDDSDAAPGAESRASGRNEASSD